MGEGSACGVLSSNSDATVTPSAADSLSSTVAVALLWPRSIKEILERLTPLRSASAASEKPWASRSVRTRLAMRSLMSMVVQYAG